MTRMLIQIPNEKDLNALLPLFERLGIKVIKSSPTAEKGKSIEGEDDLLQFFDEIVKKDYEVFQKLAQ